MIDRIKTVHGIAAIFATVVAWRNVGLPRLMLSSKLAPIYARIEALEQFYRNTRLLVLDRSRWRADPLGAL